MVFAESFIVANRAAELVRVTWSSGKAATVFERDIQNRAAELIADPKGGSLFIPVLRVRSPVAVRVLICPRHSSS